MVHIRARDRTSLSAAIRMDLFTISRNSLRSQSRGGGTSTAKTRVRNILTGARGQNLLRPYQGEVSESELQRMKNIDNDSCAGTFKSPTRNRRPLHGGPASHRADEDRLRSGVPNRTGEGGHGDGDVVRTGVRRARDDGQRPRRPRRRPMTPSASRATSAAGRDPSTRANRGDRASRS